MARVHSSKENSGRADIVNRVVPISELSPHPRNYNTHGEQQLGRLQASLARFGQVKSVVVQQGAPGRYLIVAGHGLIDAAKANGLREVRADIIPADWDETQVTGYLVADNELARQSEPRDDLLGQLLEEQRNAGVDLLSIGYTSDEIDAYLDAAADALLTPNPADAQRPAAGLKPNPRILPLDVIYTISGDSGTCCMAVRAGLKYGIQSAKGLNSLCTRVGQYQGRHQVAFVDNDYFHYDHAQHRDFITALALPPRYVTVRDVMTKAQCQEAGIAYYSLEQILDWAEELRAYADNVIVIPKYDCLDQIPDHFMLGYSVPTSHGGTSLSYELFKGRRIHLLGGSWKAQLTYLAVLGEDVVSLDNNYIQRIAKYGECVLAGNRQANLTELGLGKVNNPFYVALAISFGSIGAEVYELGLAPIEGMDESVEMGETIARSQDAFEPYEEYEEYEEESDGYVRDAYDDPDESEDDEDSAYPSDDDADVEYEESEGKDSDE